MNMLQARPEIWCHLTVYLLLGLDVDVDSRLVSCVTTSSFRDEGWIDSCFLWKGNRRITGLLLGFVEAGLDPSSYHFVDMKQCFPFLDPRRNSILQVFTGDLKWDRSAVMAETLSSLKREDVLGLLDSAIMASDETKRVSCRFPLCAIMDTVNGQRCCIDSISL